jgi:hypothetical protein
MQLDNRFVTDIYAIILEVAVPLLILLAIISIVGLCIIRFVSRGSMRESLPFIIAFSFLGGVPGVIAGMSQEPIVGGMLTSLLGIVSALLAYMFTKESLEAWRPAIPFALIFMMVAALGGLTIGGIRKAKFDNFDREYTLYKSELENLYWPVMREVRLERLRQLSGAPQVRREDSRGGAPDQRTPASSTAGQHH